MPYMEARTYRFAIPLVEMPDLAEYMTSEEAAKALGFTSAKSVRNMVYKGKLDAIRFGRAVLVARKSVKAYLEKTQGMNAKDPRRGRAY